MVSENSQGTKRDMQEQGVLEGGVGVATKQTRMDILKSGNDGPTIQVTQTTVLHGKSGNDGPTIQVTQTTVLHGNQTISGMLVAATHDQLPSVRVKFVCLEKESLSGARNVVEFIQENEMGYTMVYGSDKRESNFGNENAGIKTTSKVIIEEIVRSDSVETESEGDLTQQKKCSVAVTDAGKEQMEGDGLMDGPPPGFEVPFQFLN